MIKILLLVLLAEILTAGGQVCLKRTANRLEAHDLSRMSAHARFLSNVFSTPTLWVAFALMAIGLVAWLLALAEGDLSLVFSLGSSQYVIILFLAHFMLDEKIDRAKAAGTLLVVLGITLITLTH
jgi:drug/metabolite transporter (DMT)-like permease